MTIEKLCSAYLDRVTVVFLFFIILLSTSCTRYDYNGNIAVELHIWQLMKIDTFYSNGRNKPCATWYDKNNRINYIDFEQEFPYPYVKGTYISNFNRK